uniref:Uncharacterized protein n=1 Tax=Panagrolaimus davidi TaxID=227884 RepID=A0A914PIK5_9BILA
MSDETPDISVPSSSKTISSSKYIIDNAVPGSSKIKPVITLNTESARNESSKNMNQLIGEVSSDEDDYIYLYNRHHSRAKQPQHVSVTNDETVDVTLSNNSIRAVTDFKYTYGKSGKRYSRLLVPELSNKNLVRIYSNSFKGYFFCFGCNEVNRKRIKGYFDGKTFMAPIEHICNPISMEFALAEGEKNKKKADHNFSKNYLSADNNDEDEYVENTSILNQIQYGKRLVTAENYKFYPSEFYDEYGRIIVHEEDDHNLIREYRKLYGKFYYCFGCKQEAAVRPRGILRNETFWAPLAYLHTCFPKTLESFEREQNKHDNPQKIGTSNVERKRKEIMSNVLPKKKARIDQLNAQNHGLKNGQKSTKDPIQNVSCHSIANAFTKKVDEIIMDSNPNQQNVIPQPSHATKTVTFFHPSEYYLRQTCKKLEIQENIEGYEFCNRMKIKKIRISSYPFVVYQTSESKYHGFSCFSLYLTGNESNTILIREMINRFVYNNFKTLGECMGHDFSKFDHETPLIRDTLWSNVMTEVHFQIISRWLHCRIGIYENDAWKRYGNWKNEDSDFPTFIIELKNGKYNPILELKD